MKAQRFSGSRANIITIGPDITPRRLGLPSIHSQPEEERLPGMHQLNFEGIMADVFGWTHNGFLAMADAEDDEGENANVDDDVWHNNEDPDAGTEGSTTNVGTSGGVLGTSGDLSDDAGGGTGLDLSTEPGTEGSNTNVGTSSGEEASGKKEDSR